MLDHEKWKAILLADWHILCVSEYKMLPSPFTVASIFGKMPIQNMLTYSHIHSIDPSVCHVACRYETSHNTMKI
jgi:hypothetical protein